MRPPPQGRCQGGKEGPPQSAAPGAPSAPLNHMSAGGLQDVAGALMVGAADEGGVGEAAG
jgi:hypothetical protein